jgi:hypothetical protein
MNKKDYYVAIVQWNICCNVVVFCSNYLYFVITLFYRMLIASVKRSNYSIILKAQGIVEERLVSVLRERHGPADGEAHAAPKETGQGRMPFGSE